VVELDIEIHEQEFAYWRSPTGRAGG
jgi:hypothetical protein